MTVLAGNKTISMKDQGFYDKHSLVQRAIIDATFPYIKNALEPIPLPKRNGRFVIADYGCSEGKNSIYVVKAIVDFIRQKRKEQQFSVVFNDIASNNFNRLFENIQNELPKQDSTLLTFASGQHFHSQIMPAKSIHFGYSASAAHWLSKLPDFAIRSHIYQSGATEEEKQKLAVIAGQDWSNFLNCRAIEMASGARLLVTMTANLTGTHQVAPIVCTADDTDRFVFEKRKYPHEIYPAQIMMDLLNEVLQELVKANKILPEQAQNVCSPVYSRNMDELLAPFAEEKLNGLLTIERADLVIVPCPLYKEYLQTGNSQTYANALTGTFRAFTETFLWHQLFSIVERRRSSRVELNEQKIIDEFYARMQSHIQSRPNDYVFFPIHSVLVVAKK